MSFYEKLNLSVDIEKLRFDTLDVVKNLGSPVIQCHDFVDSKFTNFGGWSVLSRTGDWSDGWEFGHVVLNQIKELANQSDEMKFKVMKYLNISHPFEHKNPTQACVGEICKTIDNIKSLGFYPRRVRISLLKAGGSSDYHRDGPDNHYIVRIHIPIKTNEKCTYFSEGEYLNMKDDGSVYMVDVSRWHQIKNESDEDRYHIIMDAWDTNHITNNMRFLGDIKSLETQAINFRKSIDSVKLTSSDILLFDSIKQSYLKSANVFKIT